MIRFIIALIFAILYLLLTLPVLGILFLVKRHNRVAAAKAAQAMVKRIFRLIFLCTGSKAKVIGKENIPDNCAVMFAFNHRSIFDVIMTYSVIDIPCGFVAKNQLRKTPVLSWWMTLMNCFFLDREDMRSGVKMILHSIDCINSGISVAIAPEGTRSKTENMLPFKEGSFKMATKTNCPIIPVAFTNTDKLFENQFPRFKSVPTVIEFGEPIYPDRLSPDELKTIGAYTQKKVADMLTGHSKYI